jgi:hypothetical protein
VWLIDHLGLSMFSNGCITNTYGNMISVPLRTICFGFLPLGVFDEAVSMLQYSVKL